VSDATTEGARRLEGIWVVSHADYPGSRQAWDIHGGLVSVHDASRGWDAEERLRVRSPCSLVRTRPLPNGAEIKTANTFAFAPDGLHIALEGVAGGLRQDGIITACARGQVYTYDEQTNACGRWDAEITSLFPSTGTICEVTHGPVTTTFVLSPLGGGDSTRIDIYDGALLSSELVAVVAQPEPSWEAALARANELVTR